MASLQAHLLDLTIRWNVKRKLRQVVGDLSKMRDFLESLPVRVPAAARFTPSAVGGVPGEWVSWSGVTPRATLLYLHGGGYVACSPRTHRAITAGFAQRAFSVFVPEYRLAPEHPFPAAIEDAVSIWRTLMTWTPASAAPVVAGDSAGGGLALALMLKLRELGAPLPRAAALFSPWTDMTASGASVDANKGRDAMFTPEGIRRAPSGYLKGADPRDPLASPIFADLRGLPPLLIHVGARELLLDDATRLAERARAAGVTVDLSIWPVVPHVWQIAPTLRETKRSLDLAADFLARARPVQAAA